MILVLVEFVTVLCLFYVLAFGQEPCGILAPWPGAEAMALPWEWGVDRWIWQDALLPNFKGIISFPERCLLLRVLSFLGAYHIWHLHSPVKNEKIVMFISFNFTLLFTTQLLKLDLEGCSSTSGVSSFYYHSHTWHGLISGSAAWSYHPVLGWLSLCLLLMDCFCFPGVSHWKPYRDYISWLLECLFFLSELQFGQVQHSWVNTFSLPEDLVRETVLRADPSFSQILKDSSLGRSIPFTSMCLSIDHSISFRVTEYSFYLLIQLVLFLESFLKLYLKVLFWFSFSVPTLQLSTSRNTICVFAGHVFLHLPACYLPSVFHSVWFISIMLTPFSSCLPWALLSCQQIFLWMLSVMPSFLWWLQFFIHSSFSFLLLGLLSLYFLNSVALYRVLH